MRVNNSIFFAATMALFLTGCQSVEESSVSMENTNTSKPSVEVVNDQKEKKCKENPDSKTDTGIDIYLGLFPCRAYDIEEQLSTAQYSKGTRQGQLSYDERMKMLEADVKKHKSDARMREVVRSTKPGNQHDPYYRGGGQQPIHNTVVYILKYK